MTNEKSREMKNPDIAFWFDGDVYLVKVSAKVTQLQLIQASFDLFVKALRADDQATVAEWRE